MHVNCHMMFTKMLNGHIGVFYASLNLFTVIGHHPIPTEIDI